MVKVYTEDQSMEIYWIHPEIKAMDKLDRAKVSIQFYVGNMRSLNSYTDEELEEIIMHFSREIRGLRVDYDQTS